MACVAQRVRWWAGFSCFGLAAVLVGCKGSDDRSGGCVHPCDLAQCVSIDVSGPIAASEILVSAKCHVSRGCAGDKGCRSLGVCLNASYGLGDDPSCLVTVVSVHGEVVETELVAALMSGSCCSGYVFPTTQIAIAFDGSADGGTCDGGAREIEDGPVER